MKQSTFKKGLFDGAPIGVGYLAVSFAFGIFAISSGLTVLETTLISLFNLTSAGQLAAVPIIAAGSGLLQLIAAQLIINLRYSLMSVTLTQKFSKSVTPLQRLLVAFGNTDENFAVAMHQPGELTTPYMLGLMLFPITGWTGGTLLGALMGNVLPGMVISSLNVAIYGMLTAVVVPKMREQRSVTVAVAIAVALSLSFEFLPVLKSVPDGFVIILCAVIASTVMAIVRPVSGEEAEA